MNSNCDKKDSKHNHHTSECCELKNGMICAGNDILIEHATPIFRQSREELATRYIHDDYMPVDTFLRQGRIS